MEGKEFKNKIKK